jgi:sterol desaturase/sphingolipid hydroxylase (fatty acid hydroxylase superfamily)
MRVHLRVLARACGRAVLGQLTRHPPNPWWPIALYGPVGLACLLVNLLGELPPVWAWVVLPASGLLLWTLIEYALHSRLLHDPPARLRWVSVSHLDHHDAPDDPAQVVTRLSFSLPLAVVIFVGLSLGFWSLGRAGLVFLGLLVGYLGYEVIHYSIHQVAAVRRLMRPLASHHLHHHYADASRCFGVSTRLWDFVFRTGRRDVDERVALGPARPAESQ